MSEPTRGLLLESKLKLIRGCSSCEWRQVDSEQVCDQHEHIDVNCCDESRSISRRYMSASIRFSLANIDQPSNKRKFEIKRTIRTLIIRFYSIRQSHLIVPE